MAESRTEHQPVQFSRDQRQALDRIDNWLTQPAALRHPGPVFRLFGYAGSGKTTLAREVVKRHPGAVLAAFSGKAALVLSQSVGHQASTIHSLIYRPQECSSMKGSRACEHGRVEPHVVFGLNMFSPLADAEHLILDEVSMVNHQIAFDLLSFGKPILVLGDPGQLPPVEGESYFTAAEPDVMLEEVFRHADGGGILALSQDIREGRPNHEHTVTDFDGLDVLDDMPDVVICGLNDTRLKVNRSIRARLDHTADLPEPGETLICLQNSAELGLLNGQMFTVIEVTDSDPSEYTVRLRDTIDATESHVSARRDDLWRKGGVNDDHTPKVARLTFGYAITCHKAQGSQWSDVLVIDESDLWKRGDQDESVPWMYTAVTRAIDRVRIVKRVPG
jgi:exodeoxyribonuclease V